MQVAVAAEIGIQLGVLVVLVVEAMVQEGFPGQASPLLLERRISAVAVVEEVNYLELLADLESQ